MYNRGNHGVHMKIAFFSVADPKPLLRLTGKGARNVLVGAVVAGLAWLAPAAETATSSKAADAAGPAVTVWTVGSQAMSSFTEIEATVEAVQQSTLSAQATGRVLSLWVKAGDRVRAGQLLASVDDRETQTGLQRSQAQLAQSDAEFKQLQLALKRTQDLRAQGFVSSAALDLSEAQFKAAKAGRDSAGAGTQQASLAQSFTKITAPYDAWVLETMVQVGDLAVPGKPLLTIYAPQPLRVVLQWPASKGAPSPKAQAIQIQAGQEWIQPAGMQILPATDPVSQTVTVRLDLPRNGPAASWAPGQQTRVRWPGASQARLMEPAKSVLRRGEITAVYVAQGNAFVMKPVRLGADHGAAGVEVWAGLKAGDRVAQDAVQAGLRGAHAAP